MLWPDYIANYAATVRKTDVSEYHQTASTGLHPPVWTRYGVGTGANDPAVSWNDYEECWCGLTRPATEALNG